jgi:hypothetical protein
MPPALSGTVMCSSAEERTAFAPAAAEKPMGEFDATECAAPAIALPPAGAAAGCSPTAGDVSALTASLGDVYRDTLVALASLEACTSSTDRGLVCDVIAMDP